MGELRIIERTGRPFEDRLEAGLALAEHFRHLDGRDVVVLGIPRGGLVVARELADALGAPVDIVLARKIGAPGNPELAVGAVSEDGQMVLDESIASHFHLDPLRLERAKAEALEEIRRRARLCRAVRPKVPLGGKTVLVTDDGVATGSTMRAALLAARGEGPDRLIVAVPVGPQDALQSLSELADETLCLRCPPCFEAVGCFYLSFDQTEDDQLLDILRREVERKA